MSLLKYFKVIPKNKNEEKKENLSNKSIFNKISNEKTTNINPFPKVNENINNNKNSFTKVNENINDNINPFPKVNENMNVSINKSLNEFGIETEIKCFTDGGCFNNGKKGARAGYGVFFGDNDVRNIAEKVLSKQTNNVGELMAILRALEILIKDKKNKYKIELYTDSKYCLQIFEKHYNKFNKLCQPWINKWRMTNFKNIKNVDIIKKIDLLLKKFNNLKFIHVRSHQVKPNNINSQEYKIWYGNEQADKLANKGANL